VVEFECWLVQVRNSTMVVLVRESCSIVAMSAVQWMTGVILHYGKDGGWNGGEEVIWIECNRESVNQYCKA